MLRLQCISAFVTDCQNKSTEKNWQQSLPRTAVKQTVTITVFKHMLAQIRTCRHIINNSNDSKNMTTDNTSSNNGVVVNLCLGSASLLSNPFPQIPFTPFIPFPLLSPSI